MPCEKMELGRGGALCQGRGNPTVASLREGFHTPSPNTLYGASKTSSPRKVSVARSAAELGAIRTNASTAPDLAADPRFTLWNISLWSVTWPWRVLH